MTLSQFRSISYDNVWNWCAGIDLIATFYGCLYAGCVPVTVRPPHPQNLATTLPTVKMIVEVTADTSECLNDIVDANWSVYLVVLCIITLCVLGE